MIYWLEQRRAAGQIDPRRLPLLGTDGRQLELPLALDRHSPARAEPEIPWCGLLWPDATPVSLAEAEAVRRYATGKSQALFFEDFETHHAEAWKPYGKPNLPVRNAVTLEPDMKAIAGDETWTDYVLEGRVVIQPGEKNAQPGNAGLLFRVTDPGVGEPARFTYACLVIQSFIYRKFNTYFMRLLSEPAPAVVGGGTVEAPTFREIRNAIEDSNLLSMTELPNAIATYIPNHDPVERSLPPAALPPLEGGAQARTGGAIMPNGPNRVEVVHPEWNPNLKRAWAASGVASLYAVGSPFRDEDQPNKKRVIPSDTQGVRICLAMALNGKCYTNCKGLHKCLGDREVQRVAVAGGLNVE